MSAFTASAEALLTSDSATILPPASTWLILRAWSRPMAPVPMTPILIVIS
jgi:hypothetical protein